MRHCRQAREAPGAIPVGCQLGSHVRELASGERGNRRGAWDWAGDGVEDPGVAGLSDVLMNSSVSMSLRHLRCGIGKEDGGGTWRGFC